VQRPLSSEPTASRSVTHTEAVPTLDRKESWTVDKRARSEKRALPDGCCRAASARVDCKRVSRPAYSHLGIATGNVDSVSSVNVRDIVRGDSGDLNNACCGHT